MKKDLILDVKCEDTDTELWMLLGQTWTLIHQALDERLLKVGLTSEWARLLQLVESSDGPMISAQLARLLTRKEQTLTGQLNRMEAKGLLKRIPKKKGRPFATIVLTVKGRDALEMAAPIMREVVAGVFGTLYPGDERRMSEVLKRLRQAAVGMLHLEIEEHTLNLSST